MPVSVRRDGYLLPLDEVWLPLLGGSTAPRRQLPKLAFLYKEAASGQQQICFTEAHGVTLGVLCGARTWTP